LATIKTRLTARRFYVHATDLAAAHVLALITADARTFRVLSILAGTGFSVREILAAIAAETGHQVPHVIKPRRIGDPTYLVADPTAAIAASYRPTQRETLR
jgi:UDP-glucose 4-epimerase